MIELRIPVTWVSSCKSSAIPIWDAVVSNPHWHHTHAGHVGTTIHRASDGEVSEEVSTAPSCPALASDRDQSRMVGEHGVLANQVVLGDGRRESVHPKSS